MDVPTFIGVNNQSKFIMKPYNELKEAECRVKELNTTYLKPFFLTFLFLKNYCLKNNRLFIKNKSSGNVKNIQF